MADDLLEKKRELLAKKKALLQMEESVMRDKKDPPRLSDAITRNAWQGLTLGFRDEIDSAKKGALSFLLTPGSLSDRSEAASLDYRSSMAEEKRKLLESRRAFPNTAFGSELAGGFGAGLGGAKAVMSGGRQVLGNTSNLTKLVGAGALEGGIYGAGTADPGERLSGAAQGSTFGAIATPIGSAAINTTLGALRPVVRRLGESLFGTPRDKAVQVINQALDADDITPDEAMALIKSLGRNGALVDLGDTLQRQGRLVTSELGGSSSSAKRFLDARQLDSQRELRAAARRATGSNSFDKGIIEIINGAESKAAPIYNEVFSETVDLSADMLGMLERPAMKSAQRKAKTILKNEGFAGDFAGDITDVRYLDAVKRALDDQIAVASRTGNKNQKRVLTQLKNDFVSEIDAQIPRYKEARNVFSGEASIREAADFGRNALNGNKYTTNDIVEQIKQMSASELDAARAGFLDWLSDTLERQSVKRNTVVNKFAEVPKYRNLVQSLFPDAAAVNDFLSTASAQSRFAQTKNVVSGGSPTARIQSDRASMDSGILESGVNAMSGPSGMLQEAMKLIKGNTKLTPEVLEEMGRILFNPKVTRDMLKRDVMPQLFEIPKGNSVSNALGIAGLLAPTQTSILEEIKRQGLLN